MKDNWLDFTGKTYLVTGAASGMGRAVCKLISARGGKVILVDIDTCGMQETQRMCQTDTYALQLDLSKPETFGDAIIKAVSEFGKLNGLIHCAGLPYISPLKTVSVSQCDKVYRVNSYAAVELAKLFINRKIYAGEFGSIVFLSSVYGLVGSAANVGYALSKGAIQAVTKALAIELASRKIRVNCIAPGFVKSPMMDNVSTSFSSEYISKLENLHPLGLGDPEDIAKAVLFLLSEMSCWMTGAIMSVDGGFTAQ